MKRLIHSVHLSKEYLEEGKIRWKEREERGGGENEGERGEGVRVGREGGEERRKGGAEV